MEQALDAVLASPLLIVLVVHLALLVSASSALVSLAPLALLVTRASLVLGSVVLEAGQLVVAVAVVLRVTLVLGWMAPIAAPSFAEQLASVVPVLVLAVPLALGLLATLASALLIVLLTLHLALLVPFLLVLVVIQAPLVKHQLALLVPVMHQRISRRIS